ncbi:MAG: hypothetical protein RR404_01330 [Bacilli bacterium]
MAKKQKKSNWIWIIKITLLAFIISFIFSGLSEILISKINLIGGLAILIVFISLGVIFDMIGVAITSADEEPFHAKSSRKVKGASTAVKLLKNADKVSSFCNDVVGDICGILSGSAGVMIATTIINKFNINAFLVALLVTAIIASLTIGGKAIGKGIAIKNNKTIVFIFSKVLAVFYK